MYKTFRVVAALLLFAVPVSAQERLPSFMRCRDMVVLPVKLNGVGPYAFLLDISIMRPVIGLDVAKYLSLKTASPNEIEVRGPKGLIDIVDVVTVSEMECGNLSETDVQCASVNLSALRQRLGMEIAGILNGRELGGAVTLDFVRNRFQVHTPETAALAKVDATPITPLTKTPEGLFEVQGLVDGKNACPLVVDTAFEGVLAFPESVLRDMGSITDATRRLNVVPPTNSPAQVRLKSIRIGSIEILDPVCALSPAGTPPRIGMGFLKHFRVTLNFRQNTLGLLPSAPLPLRYPPLISCGLTPFRYQGDSWSLCVAAASPAAREGLMNGCRIWEIDGKDATKLSCDDILLALSGTLGKRITVTVSPPPDTVQPDTAPKTYTLSPEELL